MRHRVLIEQDEDGFFVAEVPAPPWLLGQAFGKVFVVLL
jgi:predicted RNase H-like HicB family nuclease